MNKITTLLLDASIVCLNTASSKKRALESLSGLIVTDHAEITQHEVFESLFCRERLGSTGLGHGVAIPHGRSKNITRPIGAFMRLKQGVDYDAPDGEPVDLVFALLVPDDCTNEHLEILAVLAEMFSDGEVCKRLRLAKSGREIMSIFAAWQATPISRASGEY